MQICPKCGHENFEDTDFCSACGEYLRWDETEVTPPQPTAEQASPSPKEPEPWPGEAPPQAPPAPPAALPAEPVLVTLRLPDGDETSATLLHVEPGAEARLTALVRNQSEIVDNYELTLEGLPAGWWSVEPPRVYLLPFGSQASGYEQEVDVRLHPPRSPEAAARAWPIQLVARSLSRANASGRAVATLEIAPYLELGCELRPERAEGERSARYQLVVRNAGNRTATTTLTAQDPAQALAFEFRPPGLELPAGTAQPVELRVAARPAPGPAPREHRFAVQATADSATAGASGSFVQSAAETPRLQRRSGQLALRLLLTLLAAALLIGGSFATWTAAAGTGACRKGTADNCLDYADFVNSVSGSNVLAEAPGDLPGPLYLVGSAGFVTIVLGVLALAGARRGRSTWLAGILAAIFLVVIVIQVDTSSGIGVPLLGAALAIVAGFLPVVFRDA